MKIKELKAVSSYFLSTLPKKSKGISSKFKKYRIFAYHTFNLYILFCL